MTAIRRGWLHLASGAGIGRVFGFVSNLLLSRWLGPTELGLFNLVSTTVQTSETLARCGADYALNFELGGQPEATKTEYGIRLARGLNQLCCLTTALICLGIALWVWWGQGLFPIALASSQRMFMSCLLVMMVALEGSSAAAWEVLLVGHKTAALALRQGLFFPLRLLFAAGGALFWGVSGAMAGWIFVSLIQCTWLKITLGSLWSPLQISPFLWSSVKQLLRRGLPFYASNLLASMAFYPLLLKVSSGSGLEEVGYLRVGQILQQLFSFLPATLVPVLFLRLRGESSFADQVSVIEKPLRLIWLILLQVLLLYCVSDTFIIVWLFGADYGAALAPTRLLLITTLLESLTQILVQPMLAAGQTRQYGIWQNLAALMAAALGWLWIPAGGLAAYLTVRLVFVVVPLIAFGIPLAQELHQPRKIIFLTVATAILLTILLLQVFEEYAFPQVYPIFLAIFIVNILLGRHELVFVMNALKRS